ncbi:MAG: metallophosphoesterase [Clostridiales bacterium]|nr:metallophosphoesterase [Clostridiales bacterium]
MSKKKKRGLIAAVILAAMLILALAELIYSNYALTVSRYTVYSEKAAGSLRVVFISDLHGREFGKNNSRLLKRIAAEEPDVIALVGDMLDKNSDEEDVERICSFISAAAEIAPVYFGMGNHEYGLENGMDEPLSDRITAAGAVFLDGNFVEATINGTPVRIGGYGGYYRTPHMDWKDRDTQKKYWYFFEDFENTDELKLLLNHIPTNWLDWNYRDRCPVDLVLSGHYHGGVVRIPFTDKGLFAPYVGWFPPYTKGCFEGNTATCVLSTGLAGANGYPRLFNPPEIVVVEILPQGEKGE